MITGFLTLTITAGLAIGTAKVATSLYAVDLGAGPLEMGAIAGAQSLGLLLISLPVGLLVEQFGPRRLFVLGSLLGGLACLTVPLARGPWPLVACTALAGFAVPFRFVSLNTVFLTHLGRWGEGRAGWFRGTHMLGVFLLGPAVGGALVAALGFTWAWWIIAAAFFVSIPMAAWGLGSVGERRCDGGRGGGAAGATPAVLRFSTVMASAIDQTRALLTTRGIGRAASVDLIAQGALLHFSFFVVPLAVTRYAIPEQAAVWLVTVQGVAFVGTLFLSGKTVRRAGPRTALAVAAAVAAAGEVAAWGAAPAGLWIGAVLLGLGLGGLQVVNLARFARLAATAGRGRVAGLLALTAPVGGLGGALAGGIGGHALGMPQTFLLFVPLLLALAVTAGHEPAAGTAADL